jgi:hypothetical protein
MVLLLGSILISGVLGAAAIVAMFVAAFRLVPPNARAEAKPRVNAVLGFAVAMVLLSMLAWGYQLDPEYRRTRALSERCGEVREEIFRTVANVEGLYFESPPRQFAGSNTFHAGDTDHNSYVFPPARRYRFY